ncbi:MAG: DUF4982 domain-containing protein [Bacteroidales bacterium]|nr:DUF4982 domain-containing protein [Bacteroidales bacterium]
MGVYTNCDEIEMLVNGKSLGRKKTEPFIRTEYQAVYQPGKMEVRGYRNGKMIAREVTETIGDAYAITMKGNCEQLKADGNDVLIVNIALHDKKGRVVLTADNLVIFSVTGPAKIIGVGNGNPSSHEADHATQRHAFNGLCQVILQTTNEAGEIVLTATSDGLKSSTLKIQSK